MAEQLSEQAEELLECVWHTDIETYFDKCDIVCDILNAVVNNCSYLDDFGDRIVNAQDLLDIVNEIQKLRQ